MLSKNITDLPVQDSTLRQELLKQAFLTSENDSVRGIYAQARRLCQKKNPALANCSQMLKMHRR